MSTPSKKTKPPKAQAIVPKLCQRIIDDVIVNIRQAFLDDGVGEQALQRLLHMWRSKLDNNESFDMSPAIPPPKKVALRVVSPSRCIPLIEVKKEKIDSDEELGTANQLDGPLDMSSDEENDDNDVDDIKSDEEEEEDSESSEKDEVKEEPLNSGDDLTDEEEISAKFETEDKVACQYDAVTRSRNKWKFVFRDGMMNVHGKEFIFKRAEGETIW